ncbi:aspartyl-phosphate phosphatase Spo0E family protein [Domibacillus indicus]|uniref:Spo0E family sporulation regulatory protein-aspartic acid phosphatase n=1 Tax=Domibacillus indicus TaxID=1437523 RepID=UPI00203FBAA9|nr:aspartyl-phosphate phosphatase Spo0E family protein [Domibacillus indicus]MCM3789539.1 aspartyl-phosphate phosphatase Spo0E family protein [Domibacillus indicus]
MNKEILLDAIEAKRTELLNVAFENGLTSPLAIEYSQELDRLLNLYDELHIQHSKKTRAK